MRLTRSSSLQTPGAKTSSGCTTIRSLIPQVRKTPPPDSPKASKRNRKCAPSQASRGPTHSQSDNHSPSNTINKDPPSQPIVNTHQFTRETGARKSRQNCRPSNRLSLPAVLKDSSVTVNSTRGNTSSRSSSNGPAATNDGKSSSIDSSFTSNNNNPSRGKKASPKQAGLSKGDSSTDDQLFDVEDIMDVKLEKGRYFYLIKWKGYSHSENTWEPEDHLPRDLLEFYFENNQSHSSRGHDDPKSDKSDPRSGSNSNGENTLNSSHSRSRIVQASRYKGNSVSRSPASSSSLDIIPVEESTHQLRNDNSQEPPESSIYQTHPSRQLSDTEDCSNYFSFQSNSPPESNRSIINDSPRSLSSVQTDHSTSNGFNDADPLSLSNLKRFIDHNKPSSSSKSISSAQCTFFELNDSLVPGKVVSIDKSPFGTGKVALVKWLNHEPTAWLDYDFVKLKYPDLILDFYEGMLVIDPTLPTI